MLNNSINLYKNNNIKNMTNQWKQRINIHVNKLNSQNDFQNNKWPYLDIYRKTTK